MTTREIAAAFKELYDADVSPALVSKVTDAVMELVVEWQNRPLDAPYLIVYLAQWGEHEKTRGSHQIGDQQW
ncbi:transposase [Salmonella enterica subsp. enterica serovar Teko]|nr:transposase [Salmonella enterica]EBL5124157.1 transposase [Salmonella enterica subsp. enterica serovar Rubislaw]EDV3150753.1 transposase [Salmonella enterica subsp. enterica serovar Chandans]HBJ6961872.1 transposase [Salmonella enterica subsp. enterica serovar Duisburg]